MVYVNLVNPGEIKGPHVHKNRTSYFYCIDGKMVIIIREQDGKYHEIETDSTESKLVSVSNGIGAAIINPSKDISKILVMADIAWRPNDNEITNVIFDDYDWKKWD
jgi:dTDP-4-dehydrorhamnose 3,5-epimerase